MPVSKQPKHPHDKSRLEEYVKGLIDGLYTLNQIAGFTGYTVPHLCNLKKKYKTMGAQAFVNGHKGRLSKKAVPEEVEKEIVHIYKTDFQGFNFNFFKKCLKEFYVIDYSYTTIYNILSFAGFKSPENRKEHKPKPVHRPRVRRERPGELVQLDASPFPWFNWCGDNNYYALHGSIDDATNNITGLCMAENECSYGYYSVLDQTFENFGVPAESYTDRSAIFCVTPRNKDNLTIQEQLEGLKEKRTQWQRILCELSVKQVLAWSPQAKGRIERLWRTLQGRLPWYFKKYRIRTVEAANEFLKKYVHIFNKEFAIERKKPAIWREAPENLNLILCSKFKRRCNSAGVISFQGYKFLVKAPRVACRDIEMCIFYDGLKALVDGVFYDLVLQDDITDGIDERMSNATKNIIYRHLYTDSKEVCA